jgi:hypothetical protein
MEEGLTVIGDVFWIYLSSSWTEVEYLLELSVELGYLTKDTYDEIEGIRGECGRLVWSYRKKIVK